MAINAFHPNSFPINAGVARSANGQWTTLGIEQSDIDQALKELRLEDAKNNIYHAYKSPTKRLLELGRIVDTIVQLNKATLSPLHQQLGYTLENAYSLCCSMYTIASNQHNMIGSIDQEGMKHVRSAIHQVAFAYKEGGNLAKAIHAANRLDQRDAKILIAQLQ
jgi:hypothetical protein